MYRYRPCADCGQTLKKIYPHADQKIAWGHASLEDARSCTRNRDDRPWPIPKPCLHSVVFDSLPPFCGECGEKLET